MMTITAEPMDINSYTGLTFDTKTGKKLGLYDVITGEDKCESRDRTGTKRQVCQRRRVWWRIILLRKMQIHFLNVSIHHRISQVPLPGVLVTDRSEYLL